MPYSVPTEFKQEKNKQSNKPINLYTLYDYDGAGNNLCLAEYKTNVTFNGILYTKFPIGLESIAENASGEIDSLKISAGNVNRLMQSYIETYELRGKKMGVKMVWSNLLSDTDNVLECIFYIDSYTFNEKAVTFSCTTKFDVLDIALPLGRYMRGVCRFGYKSVECGAVSALTTCDKTMTQCRARNNITRYGAFPSIPMNRTYLG